MEALQQMSLDILFCMGRVASCSTYLSSSQKSNLEMVMSESWQLVDLFIEWDWETYFTEHGQENAKYHMGKSLHHNYVIIKKKIKLTRAWR